MTIELLASHFVLIDDDPLLETALADALGVDARTFLRLAPGLAETLVLQPGAVGFECEVARARIGDVERQLRAVMEPLRGTHFVVVTDVAQVRARCEERQVPVLGRARRRSDERFEVLVLDAADAIGVGGRPSDAGEPAAHDEISVVRERASLLADEARASMPRAG